jgi:tetratricopeptide (TPR) repeat protein
MKRKLIQFLVFVCVVIVVSIITREYIQTLKSEKEIGNQSVKNIENSKKPPKQNEGELLNKNGDEIDKKFIYDMRAKDFIFFVEEFKNGSLQKNKYESLVESLYDKIINMQFVEVEKQLSDLRVTKIKTQDGISAYWYVYDHLARKFIGHNKVILNRWCSDSHSYLPLIVRGRSYVHDGWKIREENKEFNIRSLGQKNSGDMHDKFQLALNDFERAYELCKTDPIISADMISVAGGLYLSKRYRERWFQAGLEIDPSFYELYRQKYLSLLPYWDGSESRVYSFLKLLYMDPPIDSMVRRLLLDYYIEIESSDYEVLNVEKIEYKKIMKNIDEIERELVQHSLHSVDLYIKINRIRGVIYYKRINNIREKNTYYKASEAEKCFKKILMKDPGYSWAWYMLGRLNKEIYGKHAEAMVYFDKALSLKPDSALYHAERGETAGNMQLYSQCIDDLQFASDSGFQGVQELIHLTKCYHGRGAESGSRSDLEWALEGYGYLIGHFEIFDEEDFFYPKRADVYERLGSLEKAIEDCSFAIKANPGNEKYYKQRAMAYEKAGEYEKAIIDVKTILKLNHQHKWAKDKLKNYTERNK